jgi:hypothetical protein
MGEAKRRRNRRGPCPDAFFMRSPDHEAQGHVPLCGELHILIPVLDDDAALQCASVIADQLCFPDDLPPDCGMPMWKDPKAGWAYGEEMLPEIRKRLKTAPVVFVCLFKDTPEQAHFVYECRPSELANQLNAALADALIPIREFTHWGGKN